MEENKGGRCVDNELGLYKTNIFIYYLVNICNQNKLGEVVSCSKVLASSRKSLTVSIGIRL